MVALGTVVVEINGFSLLRDLVRTLDQRVMWLYGKELLKVIRHHPAANIVCHTNYSNGDIMVLVCLVISKDERIE